MPAAFVFSDLTDIDIKRLSSGCKKHLRMIYFALFPRVDKSRKKAPGCYDPLKALINKECRMEPGRRVELPAC